MKNKKIVITGGLGFIGSNLAAELAEKNEVTVIDNFHTGQREIPHNLGKVRIVNGDVTNRSLLKKAFGGNDVVFHLAAISSIMESSSDYVRANEVNINGTLNVLEEAKDGNLKVVFASSSAVYGDTKVVPVSESTEPNPISIYGVAKLAGEHCCRIFHKSHGLPTVVLRFFNVYGPRQSPSSPYAALIPKFIHCAMDNKPLQIFGDGLQTRDFVFVKDVVSAMIKVAESDRCGGEIFNIGSGKEITVNAVADKIAKILGKKLTVHRSAARAGEIKYSCADISRAKAMFGYEPKYSLDDGLSETIEYFSELGKKHK